MGNNNDNFRRFPRLKGLENYESWAIRTRATLVKEELAMTISPIQSLLDPPVKPDQAVREKYNNLVSYYPAYVLNY